LMIGLTFVFSVGTVIQSQKNALSRSLDKSLDADLLITSSEQLAAWLASARDSPPLLGLAAP